ARLQGHDPADIGDQERDRKMHVGGASMLPLRAVHPAADLEPAPVEARGHLRAHRAEGVEALGPGPLAIRPLQIAAGHVVHAGEPTDPPLRLVGPRPPEPPPYYDPDFRLEFHLLGDARQENRSTRLEQRRGGLEEDQGLGRQLVAELARMGQVVTAYADDLPGLERHHTLAPIPNRAKKSSHLIRTSAQVPTTRSARGSPLSTSGP